MQTDPLTQTRRVSMARHEAAAPRAARVAAAACVALGLAAGTAAAQSGAKLGTLTCVGEGGWGAIVASKKTMDCTYQSVDGAVKEAYAGTIRKIGLDVGMTGKSALAWVVMGSETFSGEDYLPGGLAGDFKGIGAEVTAGAGVGANVLFREGGDRFSLQPVSVQMQTGLSIAAGVQTLTLEFVGVVVE